eukprot:364495-Chlamydomonas_euryale.AAC.5
MASASCHCGCFLADCEECTMATSWSCYMQRDEQLCLKRMLGAQLSPLGILAPSRERAERHGMPGIPVLHDIMSTPEATEESAHTGFPRERRAPCGRVSILSPGGRCAMQPFGASLVHRLSGMPVL